MINLDLSGRFPVSLNRRAVQRLIDRTLKRSGWVGKAGISLALVSDRAIRRLNRQYRGIDRPTDVLSFGYTPKKRAKIGPNQEVQLGDIVISMEAVRRQARAHGRLISQELALLIVHGCLHLLGHDHGTAAQESAMFQLQQDILMSEGII